MRNLDKRRMTVKEINEVYGIKSSTVYWWIKDHKISYSKIGKNIFIKYVDVDRLLESNEIPTSE